MRLKAHAKINLSLKILGTRPDGFHEIESIMQSVSLSDYVDLQLTTDDIQLTTNNSQLTTDSRNLAWKAAELYFRKLKVESRESSVGGVKIFLEKNIPLAAGLAGGSADAAAVLFGLNQLSTINSRLSTIELLNLGAEIGSDVPFCLIGGNCTVKGRGEIVLANPVAINRQFVIVMPELEVSAKWAYEEYDKNSKLEILNTKQIRNSKSQTRNDLEPVVINKYPVIQKIKDKLLSLGCSFAQMSGSGPSVFGIVKDAALGEKIAAEMSQEFPRCFSVNSVEKGVELA